MTAAALILDERTDGGAAAAEPLKYRLDVLADSVADVVASAGGWLFDRVMAGWDANVLIAETADPRPLEVLGARVFDLDSTLGGTRSGQPHALAVSTELFDRDERIRREVLTAWREGSAEITFWGRRSPVLADRSVSELEHPLTAAAHAFKNHAMALAAVPVGSAGRTERFFSGITASRY